MDKNQEISNVSVPENRVLTGSSIPQFDKFPEENIQTNQLNQPFKKELDLQSSKGFLIHNFLTKEECQFYIEESEKRGYKTIEKEFPTEYRNNLRYFGKNEDLSKVLWKRMLPFFTAEYYEGVKPYGFDQQGVWVPLGLDDCYTFGRYEPGGRFKPHYDATFAENPDKRSIYTVQVYLNDDYEGGKTNFYKPHDPLDTSSHELISSVQPRIGSALIFNHDTLHEGAEVTSGKKYIFRVDMMFLRVDKTSEISESQRAELDRARKLFFDADNAEKDKKDLNEAIRLYVEGQTLLLKYPSIPPAKPVPKSKATLDSLSDIVLFQILKYCSLKEVKTFLNLNKSFNAICQKNALWKILYIKHYSYEAYQLEEQSTKSLKEDYKLSDKEFTKPLPTTSTMSSLIQKFVKIKVSDKKQMPAQSKNWYLTFQSIHAALQNNYMIFDFGSEEVKFCDFKSAYKSMPNKASKHQEYSPHYVMSTFDREYYLVGRNAGSGFQRCVQDGELIADKQVFMSEIIKSCLSFQFSPRKRANSPLLMAVSPKMFTPEVAKKSALYLLRQGLKNEFLYFMNSAVLVLQAHGLLSGTVIMCGAGHTLIVPVLRGQQLAKIKELPVSGQTLKKYIYEKINLYGSEKELKKEFNTSADDWHKKLVVAENYEKEVHNGPKFVLSRSAEIYFNPELSNLKGSVGIVEETVILINSYQKTLPPQDFELLQNVVITGGISTITNFSERLSRELKKSDPALHILYSSEEERFFDVLKGARVTGTLTESVHDRYQEIKRKK